MENKERDPKNKLTNAEEGDRITNSDLKDLPKEIKGSDADYVKDSLQKNEVENENQIEETDNNEEINPQDNPEE